MPVVGRSYHTVQFAGWSGPLRWFGALSMSGILRLERGDYAGDRLGWSYVTYPADKSGLWSEIAARDRAGGRLRQFGFAYARIDYGPSAGLRRAVYLPHWSLALLLVPVPALRLWRGVRARRRSLIGLCTFCGYDLRATPDRCPECGTMQGKVDGRQ